MKLEYRDAYDEALADRLKEEEQPVHRFIPELREVREIIGCWIMCLLSMLWENFRGGTPPASGAEAKIWVRLDGAKSAIGKDEFEGAVAEACARFPREEDLGVGSEDMNKIAWDIYVHGDEGDRQAAALAINVCIDDGESLVRDKILRQIHYRLPIPGGEIPIEIRRRIENMPSSWKESSPGT